MLLWAVHDLWSCKQASWWRLWTEHSRCFLLVHFNHLVFFRNNLYLRFFCVWLFSWYWRVIYVKIVKFTLYIFACPIRATILSCYSKILARFWLSLAPGHRASAYVAPWIYIYTLRNIRNPWNWMHELVNWIPQNEIERPKQAPQVYRVNLNARILNSMHKVGNCMHTHEFDCPIMKSNAEKLIWKP